MPGREDFAIIRARLLADSRAHHAAALYVESGLAVAATALATVVGHIAMLGIYTSRETTDGRLKGDGIVPFSVATLTVGVTRDVTRDMIRCLTEAGLLRDIEGSSLYVVGFTDCYEPIIERRKANAKRQSEKRARDVTRTSQTRHGATVPDRTEGEVRGRTSPDAQGAPSTGVLGTTSAGNETQKTRRKPKTKKPFVYSTVHCYSMDRVLELRTGEKFTIVDRTDGPGPVWTRGSEPPGANVPPVPPEIDQQFADAVEQGRKRREAMDAETNGAAQPRKVER